MQVYIHIDIGVFLLTNTIDLSSSADLHLLRKTVIYICTYIYMCTYIFSFVVLPARITNCLPVPLAGCLSNALFALWSILNKRYCVKYFAICICLCVCRVCACVCLPLFIYLLVENIFNNHQSTDQVTITIAVDCILGFLPPPTFTHSLTFAIFLSALKDAFLGARERCEYTLLFPLPLPITVNVHTHIYLHQHS